MSPLNDKNYGVTLVFVLAIALGVAYTILRAAGIEDTAVLGASLAGCVGGLLGAVRGNSSSGGGDGPSSSD